MTRPRDYPPAPATVDELIEGLQRIRALVHRPLPAVGRFGPWENERQLIACICEELVGPLVDPRPGDAVAAIMAKLDALTALVEKIMTERGES
jgi:hypothetical protein